MRIVLWFCPSIQFSGVGNSHRICGPVVDWTDEMALVWGELKGQFLEQRIRGGEHVGPDTDVYHALGRSKQSVKTSKLSESVRDAINRAGCDFRPYNLRCYFDTQLLLAESKGKVASDFRVFWMGHRGKIDATYTTNKGKLPKDLLDEMVAAYRRCEPLLSTVQTGDECDKFKAEVFEILTRAVETATGEKADSHLRGEDHIRAIQDALGKAAGPEDAVNLAQGAEPTRTPQVPPPSRSGEQRVVDAEAVGRFLEAGWIFQSPLNGRLAVVTGDGTVGP